jgi:copper chaperone
MTNKEFNVIGMTCNHCANSVKRVLNSLNGVSSVEVDLDAKKVTVSCDETIVTNEDITSRITRLGYEVR